ncbi:hypothetical protein EDB94_2550 [Marinobacter sp. 3-2]|uniref:hypothetical protein n=1 Tax=Marinobacter sp. 3-2 TaxID=2485141 RepID=UPI000D332FF6|nr:hypothetical protein [Marinobacter sp. 3-2]ROQ43101.1 hypothetical protein EDB94_2550 [Marinobacter sp. 3-2]
MEAVIFVVKAMAGAVLSESAKEAYGSVRDYVKEKLGLGQAVELLEDKPNGDTEQKLLAERLAAVNALEHPEFREKVDILVAALQEVTDAPKPAKILIEDIKAGEATFRRMTAEGSGSVIVKGVESDCLTVEDLISKS